jgi:hypothetical protein
MEVQALWFQQGKFLSHVEVIDKDKGFKKEKTNERKRRKN